MFDGGDTHERHEFYDADGVRCHVRDAWSVVVVRESPWDDTSRGEAEALHDLEGNQHRCGHDLDKALATDTKAVVEDMVCAYCRAVEQVERAQRKKHDDAWADGRFWYARDYDPDADRSKPRHVETTDGGDEQRRARTMRR